MQVGKHAMHAFLAYIEHIKMRFNKKLLYITPDLSCLCEMPALDQIHCDSDLGSVPDSADQCNEGVCHHIYTPSGKA